MELAPGTMVTSNVRLVRPLGQGGMGTVWVAEHLGLQNEVAVKLVSASEKDEAALERFRREAKSAASLKSPHVVSTFDHGVTESGTPYIVMELLEGETLGARLERDGCLPATELLEVVTGVGRALREAHDRSIVHRDIKPSNIFLCGTDSELHVKVLDFGIAKAPYPADSDVTKTGTMVGTLRYMSPEQMHDASSVGPSADLWSLATVAYHALTGRLPYEEASPVALYKRMQAEDFEPPSLVLGQACEQLDGWFRRALAAEPHDRFPNARELSNAFGKALAATEGFVGLDPSTISSESPRHDTSSDEMGTEEFVDQLNVDLPVSEQTPAHPSPEPETTPPITKPAASKPNAVSGDSEQLEPAPKSAVRRRRSMVTGFLLGAATLTLMALAFWQLRAPDERPPVDDSATSATTSNHSTTDTAEAPTAASGSAQPAVATSSAPPAPTYKIFPLGCNKQARPCGRGCCWWNRGCEPGSCTEPLAEGDYRVRIAGVSRWRENQPPNPQVLVDAEVWLRIGKKGLRKQIPPDGLILSLAELKRPVWFWLQSNFSKNSRPVELKPVRFGKINRKLLCRGPRIKGTDAGYEYRIWLTLLPKNEAPPKLCAVARTPL